MNERFYNAIKLRKKGKTFNEIGKELGVSYARASEIYYKAIKLEMAGDLPPKWTYGLKTKVAKSLLVFGFKSKKEVVDALESGAIRLIPGSSRSTIAGIGKHSLMEISLWAGIETPEQKPINDAIMLLKSHGYSVTKL